MECVCVCDYGCYVVVWPPFDTRVLLVVLLMMCVVFVVCVTTLRKQVSAGQQMARLSLEGGSDRHPSQARPTHSRLSGA